MTTDTDFLFPGTDIFIETQGDQVVLRPVTHSHKEFKRVNGLKVMEWKPA